MRKPDFCLCKNKGADQLRSNCEADQRLCFRYTDSAISLLLKSEISSFLPASVTVQAVYDGAGWNSRRPVFSRRGSNPMNMKVSNLFTVSKDNGKQHGSNRKPGRLVVESIGHQM